MALVGGIAFVIPNGEREEGILEKERALKDIAGTKRDVEEAIVSAASATTAQREGGSKQERR